MRGRRGLIGSNNVGKNGQIIWAIAIMSYFQARYSRTGLFLMDEPETALSPRTQVRLLNLLSQLSRAGNAQFIIATHSPIILACPWAVIYSFDQVPLASIRYEDTDHYKL
ncbi:MAG: AAA family ATPase [Thermodesulfobacteriota bacterium]|nr:AAA family ATPase [Thermodesulfobacteriota bacterium]